MDDNIVKPDFKTKSELWKYFGFRSDNTGRIINKKEIICRKCKTVIAYCGNTTNMAYHMKRHHKEIEIDDESSCSEKPGSSKSTDENVKQLTLGEVAEKTVPFSPGSVKYKRLLDATTGFITQSLQPLSIVDESSFRYLLMVAEPRFKLPHRTHFTDKIIPAKYDAVRANIERQLGETKHCVVTTDLWTSEHQQRAYASLTVHFVDEGFTFQSKCLQTMEVTQDHTAESLKEVLTDMLSSWKISSKVNGAVTDNASNMVNTFRLLGIQHFPCIAHTLQLAIQKGLDLTRVQRVLGRCKKLVSHFKKSTKETYKLREKQSMLKLPKHTLIQDCVTRWGSTLSMLERLMEQQAAIAAVLMEGRVRHLMPEGDDWVLIESLVSILKPFQLATEMMGGSKYPTLSSAKPVIHKLITRTLKEDESDSSAVAEVKRKIKHDLQQRYQDDSVKKLLDVSAFIDPRYKELPFLNADERKLIIDEVEDELLALEGDMLDNEVDSESAEEITGCESEEISEVSEPPVKKKKEGPVQKLIGELFHQHSQPSHPLSPHSSKVAKELELYKAEKSLDLDSDPIVWWNARRLLYPLMCKLVRKYFAFVATSVPSERLFSASGNVIVSKRNRLIPENADKLIFLHENS